MPRRLDVVAPALAARTELVSLVMKCLEKSPDARPPSGRALSEELKRLMPAGPHDSAVTTPSKRVLAPAIASAADSSTRWVAHRAEDLKGVWSAARGLSAEWKKSLLALAGLSLLAPAVWAMLPPTKPEHAGKLILEGRAEGALSFIDQHLAEATFETPELYALKAAALHQLGREEDERELLRSSPYQALHAAHPLLLDALAEDFGRSEDDPELASLIGIVPTELLVPHFARLSGEGASERQWGSLRYLDKKHRDALSDPGPRYVTALHATRCPIRSSAARRLAELKATHAIDALRQLSETPKEKNEQGLIDCGQDDAAEAVRELKR
jgi:hypothetical protein